MVPSVDRNPFARRAYRRHAKNLSAAFVALDNGASLRVGARRGRPMKIQDVQNVVELIVATFPDERKKKLRFVNGRPGRKFIKGLAARHSDSISFKRPSKQEACRFKATNAENLTSYLADIGHLIKEPNIDPTRLANLDESGITPGKVSGSASRNKVYCARSRGVAQVVYPEFSNFNRVTLLAVIFASGHPSRPMWIFQGTRLRYRTIESSAGNILSESVSDCLPRHSIVTTREDIAGVDSANFVRWAKIFVEDVKDLAANGRKVLLTYDGYRSHMSVQVLEILNGGGVIAYALPSHTSGTTQPLDLALFGPWKSYYKEEVAKLGSAIMNRRLDEFDFCTAIGKAYDKSFTARNILSGFRKAGLSPFDEMKLIGQARQLSSERVDTIVDAGAMCVMLEAKRLARLSGPIVPPRVLRSVFVDTSQGLTLTSCQVLELVRQQEEKRRKQRSATNKRKLEKEVAELEGYEMRKKACIRHVVKALRHRVAVYGDPFIMPRTIEMRRKIARAKFAGKHASTWEGPGDDNSSLPVNPPMSIQEMSVDQDMQD